MDDLIKQTQLTKPDLDQLTKNFQDISTNEKIDRSRFRDLLSEAFGVDDSLIMDRVFRCFDTDADNFISFEEFVRGMSVFLKGKYEDKLRFCFRVYDLNGDRYISKEEMFQMLKNCLVKGTEEDEDGIKDLVDLVLKKLDEDRDGRVSEADWASAIAKENLLMEAFGQCLPNRLAVAKFLNTDTGAEKKIGLNGRHVNLVAAAYSVKTVANNNKSVLGSAGASKMLSGSARSKVTAV